MPQNREPSPERWALALAAQFAVLPAVVAGVALGLGVGWLFGLLAFLVIGALLAGWALRAGDRVAVSDLPWAEAEPVAQGRLFNLVESLCTAAGVRQPRLLVLDSPSLNAMCAGSSPARAVIGVTSGLLAELDRVELEGVLAEEIYLIRHGQTRPATVLAATFAMGRSSALPRGRDSAADQGAAALTRYPPALAAALEKIESKGAVVAGVAGRCAQLWLAHPLPAETAPGYRLSLHDRIEALREL